MGWQFSAAVVGLHAQVSGGFLLPGVRRLDAEYLPLGSLKPAPEAEALAARFVAGGFGQHLFPVRKKAGIPRNPAAFGNAAKFFRPLH